MRKMLTPFSQMTVVLLLIMPACYWWQRNGSVQDALDHGCGAPKYRDHHSSSQWMHGSMHLYLKDFRFNSFKRLLYLCFLAGSMKGGGWCWKGQHEMQGLYLSKKCALIWLVCHFDLVGFFGDGVSWSSRDCFNAAVCFAGMLCPESSDLVMS